jgi:hypothetical protein
MMKRENKHWPDKAVEGSRSERKK